MSARRNVIFFLTMLVLVACAVLLAAGSLLQPYVSVLRRGRGPAAYEAAAVGSGSLAAACRWEADGLAVTVFTLEGEVVRRWTAPLPGETGGRVAALYPAGEDQVFVGVYGENAETLTLYRLSAEGGAERLLQESCRGVSSAERRNGTRLSVFSQDGDRVSFALLSEGEAVAYGCDGDGGLVELGRAAAAGAETAAVLPDGTLALGGAGTLTLDGRANPGVGAEQRVTCLTRTGAGLYFVDGGDLAVYYSDLTGSSARRVLELEAAAAGRQVTALSLTADGRALLLLDGSALVLAGEGGAEELTGVLYPSRGSAVAVLAAVGLGVLAAAWLLWYLLCGRRRGWMPLALHWGSLLAALALVCGLAVTWGLVLPARQAAAAREEQLVVDGVLQLALAEDALNSPALAETVAQSLEGLHGGAYRDVSVTAAAREGESWYRTDGLLAQLDGGFDPSLAEEALAQGTAFRQEGGRFRYCVSRQGWTLTVTLTGAAGGGGAGAAAAAWAIALVAAVAILILLLIGRDVRRLTKATEGLTKGGGRLRLRTGDELAAMAGTLAGASAALEARDRDQEALVQSYRRFVPEQVLTLLGKQSIQQVDKRTFASRRMAVMMIWFKFPDPVYTHAANSRLLFDSVNQVIECTASLATKNGGTVFNFAYDGYEVVMENDSRRVISTAVAIQQEVLAFNEGRVRQGLPTVTFRIALDVGDVMLGVVGDSTQMEPTTISTSFSTVRELVGLSNRLEARILCTEAMIGGAEQYSSRYLGKCWLDGEPIRVYEIFDGDEYSVRKGKAATAQRFAQAVFALYSGETAQAKRLFLELVHDNPSDGGARYYLYLADRLERDPEEACGLNPPGSRRKEV